MKHIGLATGHPVWRVFYTAPRAEKKCERRLEERGITVFLPKRAVMRQWKDRKKKVIEPLFPNYIFAQVDERDRLRVLQTDGIVRTVMFGRAMAEVSEEEIENLRLTQNDPWRLAPLTTPLPARGTKVEVTEGPFAGLRGEVISHRGEEHVVLVIPSIRQAVRINIPAVWTKPLGEDAVLYAGRAR
ncbi:MAG: UpxY family transcription antiterminator [Bacteroidetes bacterium]|nr:MAG: UpxY family transcription antiterminator [Bacteroidota bacterium]